MKLRMMMVVTALLPTAPLMAQVPTDSAKAAAVADSLRLVRELEAMQSDTTARRASGSGPINPRLLPDVSAVGDLVGDFSPHGSTQEDRGQRFGVREVEVAIQAAVDPYFRGDVFLGISDAEKIAIEQMFLTTTALPSQLEARLGRFLLPVGKINVTHVHDLHTFELPWVVEQFLGKEGLKGDGLMLLRVVSPFGWYQELEGAVLNRFGEPTEGLTTANPINQRFAGLGFQGRLRNYWDLSQASNLELSGSAITGLREQPIATTLADGVNAVPARQSVIGIDATYRWRPLQQGLYKSFIATVEVMRQLNQQDPVVPLVSGTPVGYLGPRHDATGMYAFARWQLGQRSYLGARYDQVRSAIDPGPGDLRAASAYLEFFPSEFSKFLVGYERIFTGGLEAGFATGAVDRILLQSSFALGPHKPHPF